jgi:hypothetical protein
MLRSFVRLLNGILGRCPRCMRQAFLATLGAWGLAAALIALDVGSWMATPMVVVAIGLTALWLAHVAAFALRVAISARHAEVEPSSTGASPDRRQFAAEFARVAAFAVVATALATRTNSVLAQGRCDCSKCSSNQVCCPTANGYCGCFPKGIRC